jgi:hypothetical protein
MTERQRRYVLNGTSSKNLTDGISKLERDRNAITKNASVVIQLNPTR